MSIGISGMVGRGICRDDSLLIKSVGVLLIIVFMDIKEIQSMFAEMGLATQEQREKYAEELSVIFDNSQTAGIEKKVCSNTISNLERYA